MPEELKHHPLHESAEVDVDAWAGQWFAQLADNTLDPSVRLGFERQVATLLNLHPAIRTVDEADLRYAMGQLSRIGAVNPHQAESGAKPGRAQRSDWRVWNIAQEDGRRLGRSLVRIALISADQEARFRIEQEYAGTDYLTGVYNRRGLERLLANRYGISSAPQRIGENGEVLPPIRLAKLYFDANRFKGVNDKLGHHVGDAAIQEMAQEIKHLLRQSDAPIIDRHGGDEFGAILHDVSADVLEALANRIVEDQLTKVDGYLEAIQSIDTIIRRIRETGEPLRIEVGQKTSNSEQLAEGARPHFDLYINGQNVVPLRRLVVLSVGVGSAEVSNLDDVERLRQDAERVMQGTKRVFGAIMGARS